MAMSRAVLSSAIVLYFVICLEILIMISPFAVFFYSAFNPLLLGLARYPATRWLSSFFFVHLIAPPNGLLQSLRIMGSVLFVAGLVVFLVCAIQIYVDKFLKTGPAFKALYSVIRHPQYLSLALTGIGLAILWPRFLVVVLWIGMVLVYYLLAKDEERRKVEAARRRTLSRLFHADQLRHARSHRQYRRRLAIVQTAPYDRDDYRLHPPPFWPPSGASFHARRCKPF